MTYSVQTDIFSENSNPATNPVQRFVTWHEALTGFTPFLWQKRLFNRFINNDVPAALDLPTGLGKTSVMTVWLLARAFNPKLPRRLAYVVDRRAVVDQATTIAEELRDKISVLPDLVKRLGLVDQRLPVSTLRGKLADNREWLADPTLPAIVIGTIDMTGSRLLFEGYGVSRGMRPYHAGLLGADTLFVLDEAHLCPPFQALLTTIEKQSDLKARVDDSVQFIPKFHLLPLSATGRTVEGKTFTIEAEDLTDVSIRKRLTAKKSLNITTVKDTATMLDELVSRAMILGEVNNRVLVFCDRREDAQKVADGLKKAQKTKGCQNVEMLTGTRRVYERESLAERLSTLGFMAGSTHRLATPVFLVATSAGEVGIDLDADHIVCDLVTYERMVQRLGRVNRRGDGDARIEVIAAPLAKPKEDQKSYMERLLRLRKPIDALPIIKDDFRDASPGAFMRLKEAATENPSTEAAIKAATSEPPLYPELTRALVDAWSMTSLETHAGRPEIEPWLRGWTDREEPESIVIWREHLPWREHEKQPLAKEIEAFFEAAPPHLSETLEAPARLIRDMLITRAEKLVKVATADKSHLESVSTPAISPDAPVVLLLDRSGKPKSFSYGREQRIGLNPNDLMRMDDNGRKALLSAIVGGIVIVHRRFGGLNENGLLDKTAADVEKTLDHGWPQETLKSVVGYRVRAAGVMDADVDAIGWHTVYSFPTGNSEVDGGKLPLLVEVYRGKDASNRQGDPAVARTVQGLAEHLTDTGREADAIAHALALPDDYRRMLIAAAEAHDLGKDRALWQDAMNAPKGGRPYAKTQGGGNPRQLCGYRHEFGSIGDVEILPAIQDLPDHLLELALHLIVSHHGYARPVIAPIDPHAPPSVLAGRAQECALRFARLQQRWGPWGLAWWEAIFRAADQRASRQLDASSEKEKP